MLTWKFKYCWKMASSKNLQYLAHTAQLYARHNASGLDVVHVSIYELAMHALMSEVLTLGRIAGVVLAVRNGIEDCTIPASGADECSQAIFEREAYRGLCTAATEGLTAVGIAQGEFCKLSGKNLSKEFSKTLAQEILECKRQIDQITIAADWPDSNQIKRSQTHWFDHLFQHIEEQNSKQEMTSAMTWSQVFFQSCGYEAKNEKSDAQASLMLLGLISSGALIGLRSSYASA
jgi:hypothetical protein